MGSKSRTVLVVDDSPDTREIVLRRLVRHGFEAITASGVSEALDILGRESLDLVMTDLKMPGVSGMELVRHVRDNLPNTAVIMMTGYPSLSGAVEAVHAGAEDFLPKPFTDAELVRAVEVACARLTERRSAVRDVALKHNLVAECSAMRRALRTLVRAAETRTPVLILGEPGTGKERFARALHQASPDAALPFVSVRLDATAGSRSEEEALAALGTHENPRRGTLLLQDIECACASLQDALFTELARRAPETPRVIASTSDDRKTLLARGSLRADLLEELSLFVVELPALRERDEDILLLARHFAAQQAGRAGFPVPHFSDRAVQALHEYSWPGNVAELRSLIDWVVKSSAGHTIDVAELPPQVRFSALNVAPPQTLAEVEEAHIRRVLDSVGGNLSRAAELLGVHRKTIREKIRKTEKDGEGAA